MATTLHSTPTQSPTPPTPYPAFRLPGGIDTPSISRNASTSSSKSTTTTSSTASLVAAPIRPPPIETSTAASSIIQLTGSRPSSSSGPSHSFGAAYAGGGVVADGTGPDSPAFASPRGIYGGRGFMRNGPRSNRQGTTPLPVITTDRIPNRAASTPLPVPESDVRRLSPTTPRQAQFGLAGPSSPNTPNYGVEGRAGRGLAVGNASRDVSSDRETRDRDRRQSQASSSKSSGGRVRETPKDYVFGEELGRGSYSTVVQAVKVQSASSPTSPRPPKQYAIKIINQAHLIQEKKTKYAMIERDALVRLGTPKGYGTPNGASHRRGMSGSGGSSIPRNRISTTSISSLAGSAPGSRRESMSTVGASGQYGTERGGGGDRLSVNTALSDSGSSSTFGSSVPLSPVMKSIPGRRPSRSADPPETLPEHPYVGTSPIDERERDRERAGPSSAGPTVLGKSRPPSPVKEDSREGTLENLEELTPPRPRYFDEPGSSVPRKGTAASSAMAGSGTATPEKRSSREEERTPGGTPGSSKPRRNSHAPSERSVKSTRSSKSGKGMGPSHPGVIRLYSTFNDATSLYFVLDLASNGELLTFIRKFGSFDLTSARYYAAQVLDTVEWMHESGVIHRDLKPENILLNEDMRVKITDFGSAKILSKEQKDGNEVDLDDSGKKRSFVGSADFVSPEVLRNEAAVFASDIWAFGCILYQLVVGKPPFRGATDYLTFQKILKREFEYPDGFDPDARDLVDAIFHLEPTSRPTPGEIKSHPFFADLDWASIWTIPAPHISTGLTKPQATLASIKPDSDIWAVFEDEVSDGGFPYDENDEEDARGTPDVPRPARSPPPPKTVHHGHQHQGSPLFDGGTAAEAVSAVDSTPLDDGDEEEELRPPSAPWADSGDPRRSSGVEPQSGMGGTQRKGRGWSRTSHRTSSSSSASRTALSGFLETMGITPPFGTGGSSRTSRTSVGSDATRPISRGSEKVIPNLTMPAPAPPIGSPDASLKTANDDERAWGGILLAHEHVIFSSLVSVKSSGLPSFLSSSGSKRRHLILTDFPRLLTVKEESIKAGSSPSASPEPTAPGVTDIGEGQEERGAQKVEMIIKAECLFVVRPSSRSARSAQRNAEDGGGVSRGVVLDVGDKGAKGFVVQTSGQNYTYICDSPELKNAWVGAIRKVYS